MSKKPKEDFTSVCELNAGKPATTKLLKSRLLKHKPGKGWQGVRAERYKTEDGTWADVVRHSLVGAYGEKTKFHFRYFEVSPGGHTTLESHKHEHVVFCILGKGMVILGKKSLSVGLFDTIYICPDEAHQLSNPFDEPFGFLCVVDARRDRPRPIK